MRTRVNNTHAPLAFGCGYAPSASAARGRGMDRVGRSHLFVVALLVAEPIINPVSMDGHAR